MSDKEILSDFIQVCFEGHRGLCAKKLKIGESTISRTLSGKSSLGREVMEKIVAFCIKNNYDYVNYVHGYLSIE